MKRLIGLLGWLGALLVVASVIIRFTRPELQNVSRGLALAAIAVMALYMVTQWRDIGRSFQGRQVKYGSIALSSVLIVLAILVGINWVSSRQNKRWDLTQSGQFSLSDQTKKILADLKTPVNIRVFYTDQSGNPQEYRDKLAEYSYASKQVSAQFIDANRDPLQAQRDNVTTVPTLVIEHDGRTERATAADEESITNALKKVIEGKAKKVYFLQGHGERDPGSAEAGGYSAIAEALKNDNFEVDKVNLAQTGKVPDDATVVVLAGPKTDLFPAEVDLLRGFLTKGGKVMLAIDPPDKGTAPDPVNAIALAKEWGVTLGNDLIVDASGLGQMIGTDASVPIAMPEPHAITDGFRLMTAFPLARSVTVIDGGTNGHVAQKVLQTRPESWAETDVKGLYANGRPEKNLDKGDKTGPITIAAAVSAPISVPVNTPAEEAKKESRVVVVGDSDFASNRAVGIQGNRELFLNMANWLAQQENLIAIRPKNPDDRPISMTADQQRMVYLFTLIIVPGLLFLNGIRVWWRRR